MSGPRAAPASRIHQARRSPSACEADLARRDPALPGLAALFDPAAFVEALRPHLPEDRGVEGASLTYVRYKPGTNCLAAYRVRARDGRYVDLYAKAHPLDAAEKFEKAGRRRGVRGSLGFRRIVLRDLGIVVIGFPNDDKLGALRTLGKRARRGELLRRVLPRNPDLWDATPHGLVYKPERRYVTRLRAGNGARAVLKFYTRPSYRAASWSSSEFRSGGSLRIPDVLGQSRRDGVVAFQWIDGRLLSELLPRPEFDPGSLASVGTALAELHAQTPDCLTAVRPDREAAALFALADAVGFVTPELAGRARSLAGRLAARLDGGPVVGCGIHGDFYAKQVLLSGDAVAIFDLDRAAFGDPAADLGLFVAHLERDRLRGTLSESRVEPLAEALLRGYRIGSRRAIPARLDLYTAVGLFRLAPDPFRHREPDWPERTEAILARVEALLPAGKSFPTAASPARDGRVAGKRKRPPVPVHDPFGVRHDRKMSRLARALDPRAAERALRARLSARTGHDGGLRLREIRVRRYRPGRRCSIEYDVEVRRPDARDRVVTLVAKVQARGLDAATYRLVRSLWNAGFREDSEDGISVPEPVGVVPELDLWLQRKVRGRTAAQLLTQAGGLDLARRIAEAIHKMHRANVPAQRTHGVADELAILQERLAKVAEDRPAWRGRLDRVLRACEDLAAAIPESRPCGIHRDFYADQVLLGDGRLYLLDLDLYSEGDPSLDVGNFLAHLTEYALRKLGHPRALAGPEGALEERFLQLSGEASRASVRAYAALTLVRHIHISTQIPERRPFTEPVLELCEQWLDAARRSGASHR